MTMEDIKLIRPHTSKFDPKSKLSARLVAAIKPTVAMYRLHLRYVEPRGSLITSETMENARNRL